MNILKYNIKYFKKNDPELDSCGTPQFVEYAPNLHTSYSVYRFGTTNPSVQLANKEFQ